MEQSIDHENSPFTTPKASLEQAQAQEYDTTSPFSPKGRFGRIDYLAYAVLLGIVMAVFGAGVGALITASGAVSDSMLTVGIINFLITLPLSVIGILFMIRRLHDLNWSGWVAITYFIPLVNLVMFLILVFMRGTPEANKYGPPRQPPSKLKTIVALILPAISILAIAGILAAVAIPAYQDFLLKSQGG